MNSPISSEKKEIKIPEILANFLLLLCVQEVITPIYKMSYYVNWVTTSWT